MFVSFAVYRGVKDFNSHSVVIHNNIPALQIYQLRSQSCIFSFTNISRDRVPSLFSNDSFVAAQQEYVQLIDRSDAWNEVKHLAEIELGGKRGEQKDCFFHIECIGCIERIGSVIRDRRARRGR